MSTSKGITTHSTSHHQQQHTQPPLLQTITNNPPTHNKHNITQKCPPPTNNNPPSSAATPNTSKAQLRYAVPKPHHTPQLSSLQYTTSLSHTLVLTQPLTQSAIGAVTGSEAWNVSAQTDKASGIDTMKAASEQRDANRDGFGKVEELAGKAAGCEGMEKEGAQSKQQ